MNLMEDPRLRQKPVVILGDCLADRKLLEKYKLKFTRCRPQKPQSSCSEDEIINNSLDGLLTPNPSSNSSGDESSGSDFSTSVPKKRKCKEVGDERVYEVERIVGYHRDKNGDNWYLVKWKNYSSAENSFEKIDTLLNCNRLLMEMFEKGCPLDRKEVEATDAQIEKAMYKSSLYQKLVRGDFKREKLMKFPRYETLNINEIFGSKFAAAQKDIKADYWHIIRCLAAMYYHRDPGLYDRAVEYRIAIEVCKRRQRQLQQLQEQRERINKLEQCPIEIENNVDLDVLPAEVEYITEMKTGNGVSIPNDPYVGCECPGGCGPSSKCCSQAMGSVFAYNQKSRLRHTSIRPIYECNRRCRCAADCPNRVVQNGRSNHLAIFKTEKYGWGVKTLKDINRGEFVCEYLGEMISEDESYVRDVIYNNLHSMYMFNLDFSMDGHAKYCVDATRCGNVARFMNHSCDPNLMVRAVWVECLHPDMPKLAFFAKRHIRKNEELCFDYENRMDYEVPNEPEETPVEYGVIAKERCRCGSAKCRKWLFGSS